MSRWKKYLLYASIIIIGAALAYILTQTVLAKNTGFETKTLWDWMELLIIPFVLALGAFVLNRSEKNLERQNLEARSNLEREIATDRQREAALQSYLDRMSELLLKEKLRTTEVQEVRDVARTLTISVMRTLDTTRNNLVLQFLREAKLITDENSILNNANMEGMNLANLDLNHIYLQKSNLQSANLMDAKLNNSNLKDANLEKSNLYHASLLSANLNNVSLESADLQRAYLWSTNLSDTNMADANLTGAHLLGTNLKGSNVNEAELKVAKSIKNVIMPDGRKHE